jgi:hypothetical protein
LPEATPPGSIDAMGTRIGIFLLLACMGSSSAAAEPVSREQAIATAVQDARGAGHFLGTWVSAYRSKDQWLVAGASKSANPPVLYVIDGIGGKILYRSFNSDVPVTLEGKAVDARDGATLATDDELLVYLAALESWPKRYLGRRVSVTGQLRARWSGSNEARLAMDHPRWELKRP